MRQMVEPQDVVILGAGLSGLSCAYHLGERAHVYEKLPEPGGLARSEEVDGFYFDYAPHILYSVDPEATKLIHDLLQDNLHIQKRKAFIYHGRYGIFTQFPFQAHLYGLPADVVEECVRGLEEALARKDEWRPANYREWMVWRFGQGIAKHLMIPYAQRIWTVDPCRMNFEWIHRRVPEPDLERVKKGAYTDCTALEGFNNDFWYPLYGGIEALPKALSQRVAHIHHRHRAVAIHPKQKTITFDNGVTLRYKHLVSTLPLPVVIGQLIKEEMPEVVREAADALMCNSIVCVNLGVARPNIAPYHWLYFYEDDFIFHRISFPMNCSPHTVPEGMSSVCCEIAYSKFRELPVKGKAALIERTVRDLIRAGLLREDDDVVVTQTLNIKYAYVIYDLDHRRNVAIIHDYLRRHDIIPCGRFGEWEYFNMDHSIMSGKRAAEAILERDSVSVLNCNRMANG